MSSETHLVFVYGTLRRGASNAFRMEGAEFVREGFVRGRLYRVDWYPGIVLDSEAGLIKGEIWRVCPNRLVDLDQFEGDEYRRLETPVRPVEEGADFNEWEEWNMSAWVWEWMRGTESLELVESGDWLDVENPRPPKLW